MADYDAIEQGRRYVLGETETFYGVWDKQGGTTLLEQFPLSEEGFERASDRYHELKRRDGSDRGLLLYGLWLLVLLGSGIMIVGGILESLLVSGLLNFPSYQPISLIHALSGVGYNLALGGLALLVGATLIRREVQRRGNEALLEQAAIPRRRGAAALWWVLIVGLLVWIASTVVTHLVFEVGPRLLPENPGKGAVLAATVESMAFRIWVSALAIISARWLLWRPGADLPERAG